MDRATFDKYVNERYFAEISCDRKSMRNQIWYRTLQWAQDATCTLSGPQPPYVAVGLQVSVLARARPSFP